MIVSNIRGGLGNQLFMYAFGRALSLRYNVPLLLDGSSGFRGDYFKRNFNLRHFKIKAEQAEASRTFRFCHYLSKTPWIAPTRLLHSFGLVIQRGRPFDYETNVIKWLPKMTSNSVLYTFGYWQNELYFKDFEAEIRDELQIVTLQQPENIELSHKILGSNSVCIHARRLHGVPNQAEAKPKAGVKSLPEEYYQKCVALICERINAPHFFCFADYPEWLHACLKVDRPLTFVTHNKGDGMNYADLWLMSLCKHFIISNSTFSWWGAWLSTNPKKQVFCPDPGEYLSCGAPVQGWNVIR